MKADCVFGTNPRENTDTLDCGTDCDNCGKHYYGGSFYVCPDCEKKRLTNACHKKIKAYVNKYGKPGKRYYVSKNTSQYQ